MPVGSSVSTHNKTQPCIINVRRDALFSDKRESFLLPNTMQTRRQLERQQRETAEKRAILRATPLIPRPRTRGQIRTYTPRDIMFCLVASSWDLADTLKQPGMHMTEDGRELIETIQQHGRVEVDAVVQVRLASGVVLESRGRNPNVVVANYALSRPRKPLRIQYGDLELFGMSVTLTNGHLLSLNSFGFGSSSAYMQNVEVFGNVKKKAHALQLLLDEMAYHLLHLQGFLRPELADIGKPTPVIISLYDAWRPVPARDILPPWPYNDYGRSMNSETRWEHLTGTPSYYTQFGFVPFQLSQTLDNTSAQNAVQMQADMQKKYFELCVQPHKVAKTYTDAEPYVKPDVCDTLPFGGDYFKVFEWGKPFRMFGAFAQTEVVFKDPEEYHDQVIKKGAYPPLETMSLQLVRSTTSGRKRPRGADTVTNAALRADILGL